MKIGRKIISIALTLCLMLGTTAYAGNTGGNTGSFTANSSISKTAGVTDTTGVDFKTEQYYLTVNKDANVASTTGAGWYNKGTKVSVTATYNDGYKAKSGTGDYTMDSAKTASVESQKITYSVTYNYNCPSGWTNKGGLPSNQTKTYGTNLTLSSTKPTVPTKATDTSYTSGGTGYQYKKTYSATFKEWNTKADGKGTAYAAGAKYTGNAAVTLYAIWTTSTGKTSEQYYLTINKDSGVSTATSSQWVNKGGSVNVTATAKSGYKITGGTGSTGAINAAKTVNVTSVQVYTLTWSAPLSQYGSYLGTTTSGSSSNAGSKVIVYTNPSGVTSYANPYKAGSITIEADTSITLRMVSGKDDRLYSRVGWASIAMTYKDGNNYELINCSRTPTASGTLSVCRDNGHSSYEWEVQCSSVK